MAGPGNRAGSWIQDEPTNRVLVGDDRFSSLPSSQDPSMIVPFPLLFAAASGGPHLGHQLPLWSVVPFGLMLLCIAVLPLVAGHFWESNRNKALLSMALGSRIPALRMDYKTGRLCGRYFLATVGKMLAEQPPLHRHKRIITPPAIVANDPLTMPLVDIPQANDALLDNEDLA